MLGYSRCPCFISSSSISSYATPGEGGTIGDGKYAQCARTTYLRGKVDEAHGCAGGGGAGRKIKVT